MNANLNRRHRRGSSLIEMVVLITLISFTLTTMSMLTHAILKASQQVVTHGQIRQVHARLLEQVSRDAAESSKGAERPPMEIPGWRYTLRSGKKIEYRIAARTVDREVFGASGEIEQREQFRLPPAYEYVSVQDATSDAEWEIQIREDNALQHNGRPQQISTGLRVIIIAARGDRGGLEARP